MYVSMQLILDITCLEACILSVLKGAISKVAEDDVLTCYRVTL